MTVTSSGQKQSAGLTASSSQLGHWLEEYSEIAAILPVITGLLVTTQLRLRGASALAVNLAIAAVARQVILQLKQQTGAATQSVSEPTTNDTNHHQTGDGDYTIVHSVPGRIRLQIPRLLSDAAFAQRLEKLLLDQDIVVGVRLNRAARSLAIRYDAANLTELELGIRLLQVLEQAEQGEVSP
ncbi:MAG: metal ABC transporter ATPase [Spirulinaceae cyanobacterium SM2_1_0]|nr:metal ABC transporter ATPase [Spirulinaceae cyanobacterium SM2_1_0]